MKKNSESSKAAPAEQKMFEARIDWRPMLVVERLWLWIFYPAVVISLDGITVKLYYEPVMDGGYIWIQWLDRLIMDLVYVCRLIWMKISRTPGQARTGQEGICNQHDLWEFFAVVVQRNEFRILTENWPGFSSAISTTVWFWLSLTRQPEVWAKEKPFIQMYQELLEERMKSLKAWYVAKGDMSSSAANSNNWRREVEGAYMNIDVACTWKKALGQGVPATALPAPSTALY